MQTAPKFRTAITLQFIPGIAGTNLRNLSDYSPQKCSKPDKRRVIYAKYAKLEFISKSPLHVYVKEILEKGLNFAYFAPPRVFTC